MVDDYVIEHKHPGLLGFLRDGIYILKYVVVTGDRCTAAAHMTTRVGGIVGESTTDRAKYREKERQREKGRERQREGKRGEEREREAERDTDGRREINVTAEDEERLRLEDAAPREDLGWRIFDFVSPAS